MKQANMSRWVFGVVAVAFGVGCGGAAGQPLAAHAPARDEAMASESAPSSMPYSPAAEDAEPASRQGLATSWGESRESVVSETSFERATPSSPTRTVAIRYNDSEGVRAAVGPEGRWLSAVESPEVAIEIQGDSGALDIAERELRHYVVGRSGERYSIRLRNRTSGRIEIVASVDGLDVINGRQASVRRRGYVVEPYGVLDIDGFRQSEESVAAFRFGSVGGSYAASKGDARDVGVIGVAVFEERGRRPSAEELRRREQARPFPGSDARYAAPPSR